MMRPERESGIVDLLDRVLDKGVIIHADVIISVAGVPLIGLSLKAALAGMETMLDYGMMEAWDKSIRSWYSKEKVSTEKALLIKGEIVYAREFGSMLQECGVVSAWKPGFWYLTDRRLFLRSGNEVPFEICLKAINGVAIVKEKFLNSLREEIIVGFDTGLMRIHVSDAHGFKDILEKAASAVKEDLLMLAT